MIHSESGTVADSGDEPPVVVPWSELSAEALQGVIESFVLREGTDYGEREASFESKRAAVRRQLERGEACVMFDPPSASVSIVTVRAGGGSGSLPRP